MNLLPDLVFKIGLSDTTLGIYSQKGTVGTNKYHHYRIQYLSIALGGIYKY